jgi:hypothetical protein
MTRGVLVPSIHIHGGDFLLHDKFNLLHDKKNMCVRTVLDLPTTRHHQVIYHLIMISNNITTNRQISWLVIIRGRSELLTLFEHSNRQP